MRRVDVKEMEDRLDYLLDSREDDATGPVLWGDLYGRSWRWLQDRLLWQLQDPVERDL